MTQTVLPLSEAITLQRGFDLPTSQRKAGQYPVITSTGRATTHNEAKVKAPGVVIGRSGSIGGGQFIQEDFWPLNTTLWVKDFKGNNERFIYYILKSIDFSSFNAGAAVPTLNRNHLSMLKVRIPDRREQDEIADILGAIDEKIELNRRMNETLEQIGQALFKHYFIDNPEAKTWPKISIYEIANIINGAPFSSKYFNEEGQGTPLIRIRDLKSQVPKIWTTETNSKGRLIKPGDLIVGMDAEFRPHIWSGEPAWLNQRLCLFEPKLSTGSKLFIMETIRPLLDFYENSKIGTTVIHLSKTDIDRFEVLVPPKDYMKEFTDIADPLYKKLTVNAQQSRGLAELRDSLLPRLISGKIKV